MGLFDSVIANCPKCGKPVEFQSKADEDPYMRVYSIEDAPLHILRDVINYPEYHVPCGTWVALFDERFPPFTPPIRPAPVMVTLKPPPNPDTHEQGMKWWPDDKAFTRDDIEQELETQNPARREGERER